MTIARADGIFVLAPLPRCGTNFLWDLLRLHPDCAAGRSPIWEDYLLANAGPLMDFADAAQSSWDREWGSTEHLRPQLNRTLGDALLSFMWIDPDRRLVTKSPSIENLELFFDLFPDSQLLLVVRDGRDVADSGRRTFGWSFGWTARKWSEGIERIRAFEERNPFRREAFRVVRYEDIVRDTPGAVKDLLDFLRLPMATYDFDVAIDLPIRGSSYLLGSEREQVHWDPVPRSPEFDPVGRWRMWDRRTRREFERVAGNALHAFGYR